MMPRKRFNKDLYIGQRYGKWTCLEYVGLKRRGRCSYRMFRCQCDCNTIAEIPLNNLTNGLSSQCKRCGLERQDAKARRNQPLLRLWCRVVKYPHDPRWDNFDRFQADIKEVISGHRLTPKDTSQLIGPNNYKWSIGESYKGNPKILTIGSETKECREWVKILGISRQRVHQLHKESISGNVKLFKIWIRVKKIPHDPRWDNFDRFASDIKESKQGCRPMPVNNLMPIGPDNWYWADRPNYQYNLNPKKRGRPKGQRKLVIRGVAKTRKEWLDLLVLGQINMTVNDGDELAGIFE